MTTLEEWILEIEKSSEKNLITNCGIYNDLFFWMKLSKEKKRNLFDYLDSLPQLDLNFTQLQKKKFYDTDDTDLFGYRFKENQLLFEFPNQGIIFNPNSFLGFIQKEKEIDFKYDCSMQLGLFGNYNEASSVIKSLAKDFILENKIPTYVLTANCNNPKFKYFSCFINQ